MTAGFRSVVARPDAEIRLDEAALLLAGHLSADDGLDGGTGGDTTDGLRQLDELADSCPGADLESLVERLFRDLGFAGDRQTYYDPRNSFLDAVLARRTGIPITLAVVTIEVGRRIGLELVGVGMPGHFLVATNESVPRYIDVFDGGRLLSLDGCEALFRGINGAEVPFVGEYLRPVGRAEILYRMLTNLRMIYRSTGDAERQLRSLALQNHLAVATVEDARLLAAALANAGRWVEAAEALESAAARHPRHAERLDAAAATMWGRMN